MNSMKSIESIKKSFDIESGKDGHVIIKNREATRDLKVKLNLEIVAE